MIQSNALSRRPDHIPKHDENNKKVIMLPEELFANLMELQNISIARLAVQQLNLINDIEINYIDLELQEEISNAIIKDLSAHKIIKLLNDPIGKGLKQIPEWTLEEHGTDTGLFYQEKQYIPDNLEL